MPPARPHPAHPSSASSAAEEPIEVVLEVLEGCGPLAEREGRALLGSGPGTITVVGPTELRLRLPAARLAEIRSLRRVVAAYLAVPLAVRRPREILETSRMAALADEVARIRRLRPRGEPFTGIRLAAAGAESAEMQRIAQELGERTGLPVAEDGDLLVRVRRGPEDATPRGWEVLLRITPRPLSARSWRVVDYPGAVNASIAASVLDLLEVGAEDALLDAMCGSGTFLIEQLHRAAPRRAVGVDLSAEAIAAAERHQRAARRRGRIDWVMGDVLTAPLEPGFTRIVANPPWGTLHGEHAENQELLAALLRRCDELGAPGVRVGILTHEIRRMHAVLAADPVWDLGVEHRFFQKGHHPRLFLLERRG